MSTMNNNIKLTLFLFLLFPIVVVFAQENVSAPFQVFQQERNKINESAMLVLGSWAAGNILIGLTETLKQKEKHNISINLMQCGML